MRILPLALVSDAPDDATLVEQAHLASRVTHGHLNCQVACALYVLVARTLRDRPDGDPEVALAQSVDRLLAVYAGQPTFEGTLRGLLAHRSSVKKPGGGWVLDSFWSAWEAFAAGSSYRDDIERCVRYGGDTDTTAAIAGGLAGSALEAGRGARWDPRGVAMGCAATRSSRRCWLAPRPRRCRDAPWPRGPGDVTSGAERTRTSPARPKPPCDPRSPR